MSSDRSLRNRIKQDRGRKDKLKVVPCHAEGYHLAKTEVDARETFRKFVDALASLMDVTTELIDKQFMAVKRLTELGPLFQEASKTKDFWEGATLGLHPADVADFFIVMNKLPELGNLSSKFGSLKPEEQAKLLNDYVEVTRTLDSLREKLKGDGRA